MEVINIDSNLKHYHSTPDGKAEFIKEVLSPLIEQANTAWYGAEYVTENGSEYVYLLTACGRRSLKICVTADSLEAIVRDVFNGINEA